MTALVVPPALAHPGEVKSDTRWKLYKDFIGTVGRKLGQLGFAQSAQLSGRGQVGATDAEETVLSWLFRYQPMHLSTTLSAADWFLDAAGLARQDLRVLALGAGPATEALALHMGCQARSVDFLGVDHNPHMLALGGQLLAALRADDGFGAVRPRLVPAVNHPAVFGHLRAGAASGRPLIVTMGHVLNQRSLDDKTIRDWAHAIATGLGPEGGWLLCQEPASVRLGDGKLPELTAALAAAGVALDGTPAETSACRATTTLEALLQPHQVRRPWMTWTWQPTPLWLLAARLSPSAL